MPSQPRQHSLFEPPAPSEDGPQKRRDKASECNYWDFCPNCGAHLYNAGCKYRCPRCHYFMSCSDFD
jgi:acetyl-CoA carboxylase beta subunit